MLSRNALMEMQDDTSLQMVNFKFSYEVFIFLKTANTEDVRIDSGTVELEEEERRDNPILIIWVS